MAETEYMQKYFSSTTHFAFRLVHQDHQKVTQNCMEFKKHIKSTSKF
jgi:hypothetical protein